MSNVLLIWEEIGGEGSNIYVIPKDEISEEILGYLRDSHGQYVNSSEESEAAEAVSDMLCEPEYSSEEFKHIAGSLLKYEFEGTVLTGSFEIVKCGFMV